MKKTLATLAIVIISYFSYAQTNTFPQSGNVGIGTTTPDTKLVVQATSADDLLSFWNSSGVKKAYIGTAVATGQMIPGAATSDLVIRSENQKILFSANAGTTAHMTISPAGNIGIGTVMPSALFDAAGWNGNNDIKLENYTPTTIGNENQSIVFTGSDNGGINQGNFELFRMKVISTNGGLALSQVQFLQNNSSTPTLAFSTGGFVGIGTTAPDAKLTVNGMVHGKEVKVDLNMTAPDYVFNADYELPHLSDLKAYVEQYHHLPEIPSASQMVKDGISLGDMNIKLLKKVEELTLYLIEQQQINKSLQEQINRIATK